MKVVPAEAASPSALEAEEAADDESRAPQSNGEGEPPAEAESAVEDADPDAPADEDVPELPALDTIHGWLALVKPASVLALLREPDFVFVGMSAFAGFRLTPQSYALPLVRSRLAHEIQKHDTLPGRLETLAEAVAEVARGAASAADQPAPKPAPPAAVRAAPDVAALLQAERERVKARQAERDAARLAADSAETARQQAEQAAREADAARALADARAQEQSAKATRQERRVSRLQDEVARLQTERDALQKALRQATTPAPPAARPGAEGAGPAPVPLRDRRTTPSVWQTAAAHLLNRRRYDLALLLAEEVLRLAPGDAAALNLAAQAHEARQEIPQATPFVRQLFDGALEQGRLADAADACLRLLKLTDVAYAERPLRLLLRALRPEDAAAVRALRLGLSRLLSVAPSVHALVAGQITQMASPALAEALMPPPGALGPDDPMPLDLSYTPSAGQLLLAVGAGEEDAVAQARESLGRLSHAHEADYARVRAALAQAAGDDLSLLQPLLRAPRGAAVVDGSNVALHGQEMLANPRPRLRAVRAMRRALLERGFFPVVIIADANLPHHVDEPGALTEMRARREMRLVDAGTVADEVLLREAKRLSAVLVSNDYMTDWDPQGTVPKIRYTFSHTGDVYLDQ